jgi:hypothetical protein
MAFTGLLLVVVGTTFRAAVPPKLGEIHENGERKTGWRGDGRVAEYISKRTSLRGNLCG